MSAILCYSFSVKITSSSDRTAASTASMLISLAVTRVAVSPVLSFLCAPWFLRAHFLTIKEDLIGNGILRLAKNSFY